MGVRVGVAGGGGVAVGIAVAVWVADGVMMTVGGGAGSVGAPCVIVTWVGETAVSAKVGIGFAAVSGVCGVHPNKNKRHKPQTRLSCFLPGKFTRLFCHQPFVIAKPQIGMTGHRFDLNISKVGE